MPKVGWYRKSARSTFKCRREFWPVSKSVLQVRARACAAMNPALLTAELELNPNANSEFRDAENSIGTVFFEEISELDPGCQRNLLYALPGDGARQARRACSLRAGA